MPYRVKLKLTPTNTWKADIDSQGKLSNSDKPDGLTVGNLPQALDLVNKAVSFIESEGIISLEVEKL